MRMERHDLEVPFKSTWRELGETTLVCDKAR